MKLSLPYCLLAGALVPTTSSALELNVNDPNAIKSTAKSLAAGVRKWYTGDRPGDVPGNLPAPYYWWLCGAMFGSLIDYWQYTGDSQYNNITSQAMIHQIGEFSAFMPPNQTSTLGNDDQAFWGMSALSAAENKFPDVAGERSWLSLAIAVFNTQVPRWNTATCGGGLNWQIFNFNGGYDYKNTISNGAFFNIAARLGKYTQNQTYVEWANKAWDWERNVGLITNDMVFFDGTSDRQNCTKITPLQWSYNIGIHMAGAAALWNLSESTGNPAQAGIWRDRLTRMINATDVFFSQEGFPNVLIEVACERNGMCDNDQRSFKGYLARWMGWTILTAPWTRDALMPKLKGSAVAAAKSCVDGNTCGLRWWKNGYDGEVGVGEQMAALEVVQNLLVDGVPGPVTEKTGGVSKNDPSAGSEALDYVPKFNEIKTSDKAGAAILTIVLVVVTLAGAAWMMLKE